ncbi:MAG: adenylate/guanylate cyclase domain-containing protein [Proteobacteria bacterium]|nr:adenylate/guanylate cyclase domain-containing protein [Pseudomonadota bacterium]
MNQTPVKRKLAAILAADVAGYSRMMGADEEGTLRTLAAHRTVIDGIIELHDGRVVSTAGDSVLAEFASPVEAVRCAVEVQDGLKTRNAALPEDKRMLFRIGVNLGDVMVRDDDLLGDGVNIAARLEGIAEPGGICISSSVYDQIAGKLDMGFVDIGEQSLKNIARPIRAFRVTSSVAAAAAKVRRTTASRRPLFAAAGVVLVAAAGAATWYAMWPTPSEAPRTNDTVAAAPAREPDHEAAFWESVRSSNEPAEIQAYLSQYPNGAFSALARARLDGITAAEAKRAEADRQAAEAKANAEANLAAAKARAEAEAAAARAKAVADAGAAKAVADAAARAVMAKAEADRDAAARLKREAEVAAARVAEAERNAKARAESEATAQRQAALVVAPPPTGLARFDGVWRGEFSCAAYRDLAASRTAQVAQIQNGEMTMQFGAAGQRGSWQFSGRIKDKDSFVLDGSGIPFTSTTGSVAGASMVGRFEGGTFTGDALLGGGRPCTFTAARAETAARPQMAAPPPAAPNATPFDGRWGGEFECDATPALAAVHVTRNATIKNGEMVVESGNPQSGAYFYARGQIATDGNVELDGWGFNPQTARPRFTVQLNGRFDGNLFTGAGHVNGTRPCRIKLTRTGN